MVTTCLDTFLINTFASVDNKEETTKIKYITDYSANTQKNKVCAVTKPTKALDVLHTSKAFVGFFYLRIRYNISYFNRCILLNEGTYPIHYSFDHGQTISWPRSSDLLTVVIRSLDHGQEIKKGILLR